MDKQGILKRLSKSSNSRPSSIPSDGTSSIDNDEYSIASKTSSKTTFSRNGSYDNLHESVRLNPYQVKKKGLKLCNVEDVNKNLQCSNLHGSGLAPIDDSDMDQNQEVLTIPKDSISDYGNSKRVFTNLFRAPEEVGCCGRGVSDSVEVRETHKMPPKKAKWWQVTLFLLNDINESWVILYSAIIPSLYGWVLGVFLLVMIWPLNMYVAHLLWRCRNVFPGAISIGDLVYYVSRSTWAMYITFFFVNLTIALHFGYLILVAADTIAWLAGRTNNNCYIAFQAGVCLVLLPMTQLRTLHSLTIINAINLTCMFGFVGTFLYFYAQGRNVGAETSVGPNLKEWQISSNYAESYPAVGVDTLVIAYEYQLLVLEIMAEMKDPREFPKANYWCTPVVLSVTLLCAGFRYYFGGQDKDLSVFSPLEILNAKFKRSQAGLAYFGVVCFTIQMLGSCLIRSVILTRSMQLLIHPQGANVRTWRSRFEWAGISVFVVGMGLLLSFLGGLSAVVPFINFVLAAVSALILPITLFLICRWQNEQLKLLRWYEWVLIAGIVAFILFSVVLYFTKVGRLFEEPGSSEKLRNQSMTSLEAITKCS